MFLKNQEILWLKQKQRVDIYYLHAGVLVNLWHSSGQTLRIKLEVFLKQKTNKWNDFILDFWILWENLKI